MTRFNIDRHILSKRLVDTHVEAIGVDITNDPKKLMLKIAPAARGALEWIRSNKD